MSFIRIARSAAPLLAIGFLADAAFVFVYLVVLQSYLPEALGASSALGGACLAAYGLAKLIAQVAGGMLSDRVGTRRALIFGTAIISVATVAVPPVAHLAPWGLVGIAAIDGIGSSIAWPALYSAGSARFATEDRGKFTATVTLVTVCGLLVGLGAGALFDGRVTFDRAMIAPIGATALAFAIAVTCSGTQSGARRDRWLSARPRRRSTVAHTGMATIGLIILVEATALGTLAASLRAYGRDTLGVSYAGQAALLAPAAIVGVVCILVGGAVSDRLGARRVMMLAFAVAGAAVLTLSRWTDPEFVIVAACLAGAAFGMGAPAVAATMVQVASAAGAPGTAIGWSLTADGLGRTVGPGLASVLIATARVDAAMAAIGLLFIAVAAIAWSSPGLDRPSVSQLSRAENGSASPSA